jgi:tRNA(Ile)-lysidine synthase
MINYWIAFSGGLDSQVLLHFLSNQFRKLSFKAIHINHQIVSESYQWEKHCRKICRELNIPLKIIRVEIKRQSGESLEAKAREARYNAFKKILKKNDILFTAHHLDDQAETFLFQLLRGAGLRGVSAMPNISALGKGFLVRPLISFPRKDLKIYAEHFKLNWLEDPSNQDAKFDRNYLRNNIFPLLKKKWPEVHKTFSRFAAHCKEQEKLLTILSEKDYQDCQGKFLNTLSIFKLKLFDKSRQKNLLRHFIEKLNFDLPSEKILNQIIKIMGAAQDKNPIVKWINAECRRYQDHLFILSSIKTRSAELSKEEINWIQKNILINFKNLNFNDLMITYRKGGEKFKSKNSKHTRTLKKLFQEWEIPPWLRDKIPLVYYNNELIGVVGYAVGAGPRACPSITGEHGSPPLQGDTN